MTKMVLQMRAALAKEAAPRQTVSPGSRIGEFGQDAGRMVDPDDDYEDEWSPPPATDNENDADADAVAGLGYDARSIQKVGRGVPGMPRAGRGVAKFPPGDLAADPVPSSATRGRPRKPVLFLVRRLPPPPSSM